MNVPNTNELRSALRYKSHPDDVTMELVAALGAIVIAIIGLANVFPVTLAAVAAIVVGTAATGLSAAVSYRCGLELPRGKSVACLPGDQLEGALATIILGILALLGIASQVLIAVAAITVGAGLLLGEISLLQFYWRAERLLEQSSAAALVFVCLGLQLVTALGSIVLGVLAVIGLIPVILSLVGLLCGAVSALLIGVLFSQPVLAEIQRFVTRARWRAFSFGH